MITATVKLSARKVVILINAIAGCRLETLSTGDRTCLAILLGRARKLGDWDNEKSVLRILAYSLEPLFSGNGQAVTNPDGTPYLTPVYTEEALASDFPEFEMSPEERGAVYRLLLALANQKTSSPGDVLHVIDIASWLGMEENVVKAVYKASKVEPYQDDLAP